MDIKNLIGHKIIDILDTGELMIKTDKGFYELCYESFPDGTLADIFITESTEEVWNDRKRIYDD